ncbi:MAG: YafY family transcriptional regulator [Lachnospiraceae bacterium]|nr:YafY family transcriptional regulator [Lachnospiraceae bacterium]
MQINRLFEIIYILLHKKKVAAGELASELNVSNRTIYRDIDILSSAGIPVYTEKGKGGGIRLLPEFVLNKSILSEQEQREILSALHGLSHVKSGDTNKVLQKMSTIFNKTAINWLEVDFTDWYWENDLFHALKSAILEQFIIRFDYYNSYGEKSARSVEPLQLYFKSHSWYLKGFCLDKQDMRIYKLTRLKNFLKTSEHFVHRDSVDISMNSNSRHSQDDFKTFVFRIEPEMTYQMFDDFDESEIEKQTDDSFIVTTQIPETDWLYGFILQYGVHIEVLEPKHIREIIREKAKKILGKYT